MRNMIVTRSIENHFRSFDLLVIYGGKRVKHNNEDDFFI